MMLYLGLGIRTRRGVEYQCNSITTRASDYRSNGREFTGEAVCMGKQAILWSFRFGIMWHDGDEISRNMTKSRILMQGHYNNGIS